MRRLVLAYAVAISVTTANATADGPDDRIIAHVLNRVAFGARPGDIDHVRAIGIDRYIDRQLHPERIPDPHMPARLAGLATVGLSARELAQRFDLPARNVVVELGEQKVLRAIY